MEELSPFSDTFFNLAQHEVRSRPVEGYPGVEPGVIRQVDLEGDVFSHVEGFLRFVDLEIAVTALGEDPAHAVKDEIGAVTVALFEIGGDRLRCINGTLKVQRIAGTRVGTGKVGVDQGRNLPAGTK